MILRDRGFEKRLGKRIKATLRSSDSLRREYRRAHPWWRRSFSDVYTQHAVHFGFTTAITLAAVNGSADSSLVFALFACWLTGAISASLAMLNGQLWSNASLLAFYHLPIENSDVFSFLFGRAWRRALRNSIVYLGAGGALAWQLSHSPLSFVLLLLLPALQCFLGFGMAIHLAAWIPRWGNIFWVGYLLAWSLLIGEKKSLAWTNAIVHAAWYLPPIGWIGFIAHRNIDHHEYHTLIALLPVAALLASIPVSLKRLRDFYHFDEPVRLHELVDEASEDLPGNRMGPTELRESVLSGAAFSTPPVLPSSGWMERLIVRWWSPREQLVAEILTGPEPGWSRAFHRMCIAIVPAAGAILVWGGSNPWIPIVSIALPALLGLPVLGGRWRGLEGLPSGGIVSPLIAYLPIQFKEAARVILKTNVLRNLAGAPPLLLLGGATSWACSSSIQLGLDYGVRTVLLYLALQPLGVLTAFVGWRESGRSLQFKQLLVALPLAVLLLLASLAVFLSESLWGVGGGLLAAAVASWAALWAYAVGWNRRWFDLLGTVAVEGE